VSASNQDVLRCGAGTASAASGWPLQVRLLSGLVGVVSVLAVLAGCTAGRSRHQQATKRVQQEVAATVTTYLKAIANGDYRGACALLAPDAQTQAPSLLGLSRGGRCETAMEILQKTVWSPDEVSAARGIQIDSRKVQLDGSTATVPRDAFRTSDPWLTDPLHLREVDSHWRVYFTQQASNG
jgi:hypothetical protein